MNRSARTTTGVEALRGRAEARLGRRPHPKRSGAGAPGSDGEARRLLHELQVHQVELELQNTELQEARDRLEALLAKYTDLYDFAPVGYFSFDEQGLILEVNLAGAALLGVERSRLLGQRFPRFVAPPNRPGFVKFLADNFAGRGEPVREFLLVKADGATFWANLHASASTSPDGPARRCRVAVSDLTVLKQAEETRQRFEALTVRNSELRQEIVRREAVEAALRTSEQQHRRLLGQARRLQEQLRRVSHGVLRAQEEERRRISRELHDDVAQTLVGINVHLESLAREAAVNPTLLKGKIARTQRLVEKSVNIVQQFARELRPTALDDLGLIATLHSLLKEFMKRTGIRVHFSTFAGVEQLNETRLTVLYRVVQSALSNVAEHAHASQVEVSICRVSDEVHLKVSDNGRSFPAARPSQARRSKRLGLLGMRERVEMVGGKLSIESTPGEGTTIRAVLPFVLRGRGERRAGPLMEPSATGPERLGIP
jgi:PAS domain S-box-containing protein